MNIKNDFIVIMTLLHHRKKDIEKSLTTMKDVSIDMLKYSPNNIVIDHRLIDEFSKLNLLILFNTPYPSWNNKEEYSTIYPILEDAIKHTLHIKNITFDLYGNLTCNCNNNRKINIINELFTFKTIKNIHKFIATNYPLLTHFISSQLITPQFQIEYGVNPPINFTTFILKGTFKKILPKECIEFINQLSS